MFIVSYNSFDLTRLGIQEYEIITRICNDRVSDKAKGDVFRHLPSFREFIVNVISFNKVYMQLFFEHNSDSYLS